jgi:putative tryptophan/tyrosine transport system substrate-binding protein
MPPDEAQESNGLGNRHARHLAGAITATISRKAGTSNLAPTYFQRPRWTEYNVLCPARERAMRRREFITQIGATITAWPLSTRAEALKAKTSKVGFLFPGPEQVAKSRQALLLDGLLSEGFREADQVTLLTRATNGDSAKIEPLLKELIAEKVDVLIPLGPPLTRAAASLTNSIPIVTFDLESDPIESGWLRSYAHPGGNITGVFSDFPDFSTKWLELLKEAVPNCAHIVVLWDPPARRFRQKP